MDKRLVKIRKLVEKKFGREDWQHHMLPMIKNSLHLARVYKVDQGLIELAALMHDIALTENVDDNNHHLSGVPMATKILKKFQYDTKIIKEVSHCIESHRGSKGPKPKTLAAKIIANADAMAHFDALALLIYYRAKKHDFRETTKWVVEKIERDWRKKLTLPAAKKMVKKKYIAIRMLLKDFN